MSQHTATSAFDPNAMATLDGIFGLPFDTKTAAQVILPVPWEATVSYRTGTASAPEAVLQASKQVDLYDPFVEDAWKVGLAMHEDSDSIGKLNVETRAKAERYLSILGENGTDEKLLAEINADCEKMNEYVRAQSRKYLNKGKLVCVLGGDHSAPLGLIEELAKDQSFGILHIDAHADLRDAYEGFRYSHASIMFNVMQIANVSKLVQVGIRDYCDDEVSLVKNSDGRLVMHTDREMKAKAYRGESWHSICQTVIKDLPENVYLSFDIDGLDPKLCPNTGTPVPGGLEYEQSLFLVHEVLRSGRKLIGFDICEVAPGADEWDASVGARLLYNFANLTAASNGLAKFSPLFHPGGKQ
ncbi:MAG TPA: agmatinase family protein [Drouetiella sp.]